MLRTIEDVAEWVDGALLSFGDPAKPVTLLMAQWVDSVAAYRGDSVVLGPARSGSSELVLRMAPMATLPISLQPENAAVVNGKLLIFGIKPIGTGTNVWALDPSLNIPGFIHVFVILHGTPPEATWLPTLRRGL